MIDISTEQLDSKSLAQDGENVSLLKALKPFQIVSLFDMLEINLVLCNLSYRMF